MSEIVLTRVDDRLIHGQVMTAWVKVLQANKIVIIDNETAKDPFMFEVLSMSVPKEIKLEIYDISEAKEQLPKIKEDSKKEKVIILVKSPLVVNELVEGGVQIKNMIIGGMGARKGRKTLYKNISASQEEKDTLQNLVREGLDIKIHIIPSQKAIPIEKVL